MLSPFPFSPLVSSTLSLLLSSGTGGSFSVTSSTCGLSDGSGASDLSDRPDRVSEYLPSGSFPFLSNSFSCFDSPIVSWNRTPIRKIQFTHKPSKTQDGPSAMSLCRVV